MIGTIHRVTVEQAIANAKRNADHPKNRWLDAVSIVIYLALAIIWGITLFPGNHLETLPDAFLLSFALGIFFIINQVNESALNKDNNKKA